MPKVRAERLREIGRAMLVANGAPEAEAAIVARHCVSANLAGHDSRDVLHPGGPENAKEAERRRGGVEVEDSTWGKLSDLAEAAGLSAQLGFA